MVFWDMIAGVYDLFEKLYNGRCYAEIDIVDGQMPCAIAVIKK